MKSVLTTRCYRRVPQLALCLLLPLLGVAGCTRLGPEFQAPNSAAPESWSQWHAGPLDTASLEIDRSTAPEEAWWQSFADPTLDALQARLHNGPDMRDALLNFTRTRLQRQWVAGEQGVQLDASGSAGRQRISEYGSEVRMASIATSGTGSDSLVQALAQPYSLYQAGFDASWELDLWGRISRSIEAADADSRAAAALLAQTRLSLSAELSRLYFELRAVQAQSRLLLQEIELQQQQLNLQQADVDAGLASEVTLESRRSELKARQAGLAPLQAQETELRNAIALLLGEQPGVLTALLDASDQNDVASVALMQPLSLGVPSELARRRPDILAAEARLHAATARIGVAIADLYPSVTLGAGVGLAALSGGDFGEWGSRQWSLGPAFYLPVFHQGRLRTRIKLSEVEQQRAAIAYRKTVLGAWQEIDNALTRYRAQLDRHARLQQQLASTRRQQELIAASARAGLVDQRKTLDARRAVLAQQRQLVQSAAQLNIARVAVYKAVAGGVDGGDAQPVREEK